MPAPHDITDDSLAAARARFDGFRLQIWQSTSAQRGHPFRTKVIALLPVGTRRFAVLSRTGSLVLRLLRKLGLERDALQRVDPQFFPTGFQFTSVVAGNDPGPTVLTITAPEDPTSWEAANGALSDLDVVVVNLSSSTLQPGGAAALRDRLLSTGASVVIGDDVIVGEGGQVTGRFRPKYVGAVALLSYDAVGGVACFDGRALQQIGGFSTTLGALGLHDAVARLVKAGGATAHVARVVASSQPRTEQTHLAHAAWTVAHLSALGLRASANVTATGAIAWRVTPDLWPSVTIVIPTRDRLDLLERCLNGVEQSSYPNFSVVICDNDSIEPATLRYLDNTSHTVVKTPGPFNYSAIVNAGVAETSSDYVVTLNNDVEISDVDWLEQLVSVALLPGVGIVGCALREPSGAYQHEGIAIAPYPQHLRRDLNYIRVDEFLTATREVAAVTGACTLVKRSLWEDLRGLDPTLAVIGNDVDLCLRAAVAAMATVYLAQLQLTHAESSSRGSLNPPEDIFSLVARWGLFDDYVDPWFPEALRIVADQVIWSPQ